ncbi:MAG: tetratricopeptide repeat protein [Candidatus Omnitrophica bacterium]|nr:tetratricopeptide repeat protein [Candidatus Omnitrophota bacterium]MBU1928388.1 tetratricopeptide repeat protein [Candidatus Omnitrophota bacterium]MBU2035717.1 tetratricopeptide repeat protein [Candidatus Omnitrophota bacterium]
MDKTKTLIIFFLFFFCLSFFAETAFSSTQAAEFLCELGISFYKSGRHEEALTEFKKVLLIEPANKTVLYYINNIFNAPPKEPAQTIEEPAQTIEEPAQTITDKKEDVENSAGRNQAMLSALEGFKPPEESKKTTDKAAIKKPDIKISGDAQVGFGFRGRNDFLWKRANYDFNEKNYRVLSEEALDNKFNTFDQRIFDRLKVRMDSDHKEGFNFHSEIAIDPWSFTGKGPKTTLTSEWGDTAEVELKYWSNSGYIIGETILTSKSGNSFSIPELKVLNHETDAFAASGAFQNEWGVSDIFRVPATKIEMQFQPVRELWIDYKNDNLNFRVFPMAYQTQAFTTDDPLTLSNNHIWWEPSPWLRKWNRGIYNYGVTAPDFTKGYWDDSLASYTKDSDGIFLTALRGFSFSFTPGEETSFSSTFASPKGLWQDYSEVDNLISANRLKQRIASGLILGATYTSRTGFNLDDKDKVDSRNNVFGADVNYEIKQGIKASLEAATSRSANDLTNSEYKTKYRGNAFYFSIINRYPAIDIIDSSYDSLNLGKGDDFMLKTRLFGAHMDRGFDPALSNYRQTRDDTFWGRHIHFRRPLAYQSSGLYNTNIGMDDINPFKIGNGVDAGRDALGFRLEMIWKDKTSNLFDTRNVHDVNGKFIENVARDEFTWQATEKLTFKTLGIYQAMPKTKAGIDPFMNDPVNNRYLANDNIEDNKDCSLKTGSMGLEYQFFNWLALNGVWERTNDYTLAYDNFPRGLLNSANRSYLYTQNGLVYRDTSSWLYDQGLFPNPPYHFYNIFKSGLRLNPMDNMEIYLDYTRNEFESAGQISEEMNHIGTEVGYLPNKKLGLFFRYVYSRWQDLDRLRQGITSPRGHHNLFSEIRYMRTKDEEFVISYGDGGYMPVGAMASDPFGGGLSALDIQHIIRLFYRKKF